MTVRLSEERLFVVIPVYNEEESITAVIDEWVTELDGLRVNYQLIVVDDGSTDLTGFRLAELAKRTERLQVVRKSNSGHGASCIHGYGLALQQSADWIFQIDSDGQCAPEFFAEVWRNRASALAVMGRRVQRDDGWARTLISNTVRWTVHAATGAAVADPNVPYRLVRADVMTAAIRDFPDDFRLANILLAVILQQGLGRRLSYVDIGFRQRRAGVASVRWWKFAFEAAHLVRSLQRNAEYVKKRSAEVNAIDPISPPSTA